MSKKRSGDEKQSQRDRCLEIAARIKREKKVVTPTAVTRVMMKAHEFTQAQLDSLSVSDGAEDG